MYVRKHYAIIQHKCGGKHGFLVFRLKKILAISVLRIICPPTSFVFLIVNCFYHSSSLIYILFFFSFRSDFFISSESDKYITSKPYETYEEMMKRLDYDGKARIIQRNYRVYKLLKYIKEYARQYRELVKGCKLYEAEKIMLYRYVTSETYKMHSIARKRICSIHVSGRGINRRSFEESIPKLG